MPKIALRPTAPNESTFLKEMIEKIKYYNFLVVTLSANFLLRFYLLFHLQEDHIAVTPGTFQRVILSSNRHSELPPEETLCPNKSK